MPPIADSSLGTRFWITSDVGELSRMFGADDVRRLRVPDERGEVTVGQVSSASVIGDDSTLQSLASGADGYRFRHVFARAKILAPLFHHEAQPGEVLEARRQQVAAHLGVDYDRMARKIAKLNRCYLPKAEVPAEPPGAAEIALAREALGKMLLSAEFDSRSRSLRPLDRKGLLALANAALGTLKLIREGALPADKPVDYLMGGVVDISKPAEMLKLAVKTAQRARAVFIDEDRIREAVSRAKNRLLEDFVAENADATSRRIEALYAAAEDLISARRAASAKLDLTFDLGDAKKGTVDAKLKAAAEAMRAFRYDLDRCTRRAVGGMEGFRRWSDNLSLRPESRRNRVDAAVYNDLLAREHALAAAMAGIAARQDAPALALASVADTSRAACELTHATNNHIRYYFTSAETKRERFAADMHRLVDPLVKDGGLVNVMFEAGADVRGGLNLGGTVLDARAGVKYQSTAAVSVKPGGGEVTVTYFTGALAEAKGQARLGFDPARERWGASDPDGTRLGVEIKAGGEIGGGKGRTVTYRSLDDFIRDCNGESSLTRVGTGHTLLCIGKVAQGLRSLVHKARDFVTWMGLRIHKSVVDNTTYRKLLQRNGVLGELDTILSNQSRGHVRGTSEREYSVFKGGFNFGADVSANVFRGIDDATGEDRIASKRDFGGSFRYTGERQFGVHGREMRARIETFRLESDELLRSRVDRLPPGPPQLRVDLGADDPRIPLAEIERALTKLENEAQQIDPRAGANARTDAWTLICAKLRALTVQYVLLERRVSAEAALEADAVPPGTFNRELLAEMRGFSEKRLVSPELDIPEEVFDRELVDTIGEIKAGRSIHRVEIKGRYDLGTGMRAEQAGDVGAEKLARLQPDGIDPKVMSEGRELGRTALSAGASAVQSEAGLAGSVTGYLQVETPHATSALPWRNGRRITLGVRLEPNLPVRILIDFVAGQILKSMSDVEPEQLPTIRRRVLDETYTAFLYNFGITTVSDRYRQWPISKVVKSANGVPVQGLEPDFAITYAKDLEFRFEDGRLASVSVAEGESAESTLGARLMAGPVGIGFHLKSAYTTSNVERSVFPHPSFDTLCSRTEEFVRSGQRGRLATFLAHNRRGALKLVAAARTDAAATEDSRMIRERVSGAFDRLGQLVWSEDASTRDRARLLILELYAAERHLDGLDADATDGVRLAALEELLVAVTRTYQLAAEAAFLRPHARP